MFQKSMRNGALLVVGIGTIAVGLAQSAPVASQSDADTQAKIESAMKSGPSSISAAATIYDNEVDDAGNFIVLREGSNGWSCFPDAPGTPDVDPQCLDETWMEWLEALVAGEEPDTQVLGLAYMLSGGSDASNTDPYATEPEAGDAWITTPAHVMLIMPGEIDQSVFTTDPLSGEPFIMYAGTPYEHIMMPVDAHAMVEMGDMGSMGQMAAATPSA
jgi:hypothetical protein